MICKEPNPCVAIAEGEGDIICGEITSAHNYWNGKALTTLIGGKHIPITVSVKNGDTYIDGAMIDFNSNHPYPQNFIYDNGVEERIYKQILSFNVDHWKKCYLAPKEGSDGAMTLPFTYNRCKVCNAVILGDDCEPLTITSKQRDRIDRMIYKFCDIAQDCGDCALFSGQNTNMREEC